MKKVIITIIMVAVALAAVVCAYTTAQNEEVEVVRAGTLMNISIALDRAKGDVVAYDNNETQEKKPENAWRRCDGHIDDQGRFIGTWTEIRMFYLTHPDEEIHWVCSDNGEEGITVYYGDIWSGVSHTTYI